VVAGLIVGILIYTLFFGFPDIPLLVESLSVPDMFFVLGIMVAASFIQTIINGIIMAYMFIRSKSLYMPIGYIFAWHLFYYVFQGFVSLSFIGATFPGYNVYVVSSLLQVLISFLVLALVWYFYSDLPEGSGGLKSKLQNVADFFRYHDEED
jgi:hypothetical protein